MCEMSTFALVGGWRDKNLGRVVSVTRPSWRGDGGSHRLTCATPLTQRGRNPNRKGSSNSIPMITINSFKDVINHGWSSMFLCLVRVSQIPGRSDTVENSVMEKWWELAEGVFSDESARGCVWKAAFSALALLQLTAAKMFSNLKISVFFKGFSKRPLQ